MAFVQSVSLFYINLGLPFGQTLPEFVHSCALDLVGKDFGLALHASKSIAIQQGQFTFGNHLLNAILFCAFEYLACYYLLLFILGFEKWYFFESFGPFDVIKFALDLLLL